MPVQKRSNPASAAILTAHLQQQFLKVHSNCCSNSKIQRILKLVSGTMMLGLGLVLLVNPILLNSVWVSSLILAATVAISLILSLNYMGPFKIALSHSTYKGASYRIHGNNNPKRIGQRVTGGCFVMDNKDGLALARQIRVGTVVHIVP